MSEARTPKVKLDWSPLLGFEQGVSGGEAAGAIRLTEPRLGKIGVKLGPKPGFKPGIRFTA